MFNKMQDAATPTMKK
jgi:hypothetical protein